MDWIIALIALTVMEIVLGIDNLVLLAIVTGKLPVEQRPLARRIGLLLAMFMRIGLLCAIVFIMKMEKPIFHLTDVGFPTTWFAEEGEVVHPETASEHRQRVLESDREAPKLSYEVNGVSVRDLILVFGGLFLLWNSVKEIHEKIEHNESESHVEPVTSFRAALLQIVIYDLIFSLDSVITAVGMAERLPVMIAAVVTAMLIMILFANHVSDFVNNNPTLAMLALSFLILIGVMLIAEGIGTHVNKGYIYFAMAFSLVVEVLNLRIRGKN